MTTSPQVAAEAFGAWAEVYDAQPNPLLSLEQRVLGNMLPDVRGLDVLDAGCGTGRWLQLLAGGCPRRLVGVDSSAEMLSVAAGKLGSGYDLRIGTCTALPVADAAFDLVVCSFVASYVEDFSTLMHELYRVARPGATILITDMHPATEAALGWKRSFRAQDTQTAIPSYAWPMQQIADAIENHGCRLISLGEPTFGLEERNIFEDCGKLAHYDLAAGLPAIYLLEIRKPASSARRRSAALMNQTLLLSGARCAFGPDRSATAAVTISEGRIESIQNGYRQPFLGNRIDLSRYLLLPGLINAHDHLEFSLYPNIGDGPYGNAEQWARDIHANSSSLIALHREVPLSTSLWWGAIRNLLSGVTTVCHHNEVYPELLSAEFPVRVIAEFGWAHSACFEPDLASKLAGRSVDLPFILHAAEGVDEASAQEIFALDRMQALDERTILVHALGCTPEAACLINQRGAAVVLCPTSNEFLFRRSMPLSMVRSLDRVILGSDSPLTAFGDLLDEIRFAQQQTRLDAHLLYAMVTERSAEVLRRQTGEGALRPGGVADVLVVRDSGATPADTLAGLTSEQIELVIVGGRVQLAGPDLIEQLPPTLRRGLQRFDVDGHPRWVRASDRQLAYSSGEDPG